MNLFVFPDTSASLASIHAPSELMVKIANKSALVKMVETVIMSRDFASVYLDGLVHTVQFRALQADLE